MKQSAFWTISQKRAATRDLPALKKCLRALIDHILVVKGGNNEKLIIPKLVLEIPTEFASLYYDHQSLEYIEAWQTDEPAKPM